MVLPIAECPSGWLPILYDKLFISNFSHQWWRKWIGIFWIMFPSVSYFFIRDNSMFDFSQTSYIPPSNITSTTVSSMPFVTVSTSLQVTNVLWLMFSLMLAGTFYFLHTRYFNSVNEVHIFSPAHLGDTARAWKIPKHYDKNYKGISACFVLYCLFEIQYNGRLYFANHANHGYQFWGLLTSFAWAYYFMVCMAIYLYEMTLLLHLKYALKEWMTDIRRGSRIGENRFLVSPGSMVYSHLRIEIEDEPVSQSRFFRNYIGHSPPYTFQELYVDYDIYYRVCRKLTKWWAMLIACTFTFITFRIPMSILLIFRRGSLAEIPIFLLLIIIWSWMLYLICYLNEENRHFRELFYKYRITNEKETIDMFIEINRIKPLGLNLFGVVFTFEYTSQVVLLVFNVILPVLFALINEKLM